MKNILAAATVLLLLAGCTGPAETLPPQSEAESPPGKAASTSSQQTTNDSPGLIHAPDWQVGDWWTFRIGSSYAPAREITTIVVGADPESYAIAASTETTALESIWWHLPPIGVVSRADLAWEAHDEPMKLLAFPISDGKRWTGSIEGTDVDFSARLLPTGSVEVRGLYEGDYLAMTYVYDPSVRNLRNATLNYGSETHSWSTLELLGSGRGYAQSSFLPMYDDAFLGGFGDVAEPRPMAEFEVPDEASHVMFGCLAEGIVGEFRVQVTPSAGPAFSCGQTFVAPGASEHMEIKTVAGASGTWRILPTIVGPGSVFVEAAAVWLLSCDPTTAPSSGLLLKPHGNCRMP